jgi:hypothetical protein
MLVESMPAQDKLAEDMPALCMLAESMPAQDKLAEDMPVQGEVVEDKPALSMLAESMPAQDKLTEGMPAQGELVVDKLREQYKRKLHQMETDSPAIIVIAYMCIIAKLGNGAGVRIGMNPLRGVFWTLEGLV